MRRCDSPWHVYSFESWGRVWLPQSLLALDFNLGGARPGNTIESPTAFSDGEELRAWRERLRQRVELVHNERDRWLLDQLSALLDEAISVGEYAVVAVTRGDAIPVTPIDEGTLVTVRLDQLAAALHDAWIDFDTVILEGATLRWTGYVERGRARYPYLAIVAGCDEYELKDDAQIGGTSIADLEVTGQGFLLRGHFPATIRLRGSPSEAEVRVAALPRWQRRWWRWRPAPADPFGLWDVGS